MIGIECFMFKDLIGKHPVAIIFMDPFQNFIDATTLEEFLKLLSLRLQIPNLRPAFPLLRHFLKGNVFIRQIFLKYEHIQWKNRV